MPKALDYNHLCLIDGQSFIFRAFYSTPPMARDDGTPVNAVYAFTEMLARILNRSTADHVAVIFDVSRQTFRSVIYPDYKANRPPVHDDLKFQIPLCRDACRAFGLTPFGLAGFEADDVIATYCATAPAQDFHVTIVSPDKDLMQLMRPPVQIYDPLKKRILTTEDMLEKFGVTDPDQVIDCQALIGDKVDNVPGVDGIGPKIAGELIRGFGNLDNLLANTATIKQKARRANLELGADLARLSRRLVTLETNVPDLPPIADFARPDWISDKLFAFLKENGFLSLVEQIKRIDEGHRVEELEQ